MFDQDADEALIRTENGAMKHDGAMLFAILANIGRIEPFRQHPVRLDRADLPGAADRISQVPFQLGCIERAFAGQFFPAIFLGRQPRFDHGVAQFLLRLVPIGVGAVALGGTQRELDRIGKAEVAVYPVCQLAKGAHFGHDLVFAAEDMRIVLRELAHAHQSVQRAMRFVAMAAAVLVNAQRQVAIALDPLAEDQHMRRAVHGLERHPLRLARNDRPFVFGIGHFVRDDEHVFAIFAPVARLFPLPGIHHLRGLDLAIARPVNGAAHIGFQLAPDDITPGMPENAAMRLFLQVEQVHLAPQLAVIALGRFLQPHEMVRQLLLVEPAGAVNAGQLRVLLIAAPIGARHAHQLERLRVELASGRQMRPPAHVQPVIA